MRILNHKSHQLELELLQGKLKRIGAMLQENAVIIENEMKISDEEFQNWWDSQKRVQQEIDYLESSIRTWYMQIAQSRTPSEE